MLAHLYFTLHRLFHKLNKAKNSILSSEIGGMDGLLAVLGQESLKICTIAMSDDVEAPKSAKIAYSVLRPPAHAILHAPVLQNRIISIYTT